MGLLRQSTVYNRVFLMVLSSDHLTGAIGKTVTVNLSKDAGAFEVAGGAVAELGHGWYNVALTVTDTGTAGDLAYNCTAAGCDNTDFLDQVDARVALTSPYDPAKTAAQAGDAMALTSGERDSVAAAALKLDWATVTGAASRSTMNALRFLRNKWSFAGTTLTVTEEDDTTSAWTGEVTTSGSAQPITSVDPT